MKQKIFKIIDIIINNDKGSIECGFLSDDDTLADNKTFKVGIGPDLIEQINQKGKEIFIGTKVNIKFVEYSITGLPKFPVLDKIIFNK